jgi:3-hydroxy-5-phosphonooxypentane-2,4-dione thiolase
MADAKGNEIAKDYHFDSPVKMEGFHVKGMNNVDWGMKNRLSRIFNPESGNTVMLAFDHGYIMGSTAGLERLDIVVPELAPYVDCLMGTRGALRACVPPSFTNAVALRVSAGSTVAADDVTHEVIGVDMEDALRINASCVAVQTFIGVPDEEKNSIQNLVKTVDAGYRYGVPTLGVVAVGKQMARDTRFFLLATRVVAELGANIIKTYYCDEFEKVVAACPVPIVVAGGKKVPEKEAMEYAYNAITRGASGVDMGRNIFQAEDPKAMTKAINMIVHQNSNVDKAYEFYLDTKKK